MHAQELLHVARSETGLDDFGDDSFRDGLDRLVRSLGVEARLSPLGEFALPRLIVKHLSQRLQIEVEKRPLLNLRSDLCTGTRRLDSFVHYHRAMRAAHRFEDRVPIERSQ